MLPLQQDLQEEASGLGSLETLTDIFQGNLRVQAVTQSNRSTRKLLCKYNLKNLIECLSLASLFNHYNIMVTT